MSGNPYLDQIRSPDQITIETLSNLISENRLAFDLITESVLIFKQAEGPLEDLLGKHDDDHIEGVKRLRSEQDLLHKLKSYLREVGQFSTQHSARGYESFRTMNGTAKNVGLDLRTLHMNHSMNRIDTQTSVGAKSLALDRDYLDEMKQRVSQLTAPELKIECLSLLEDNFNLNFDYTQIQETFVRQSKDLTDKIELQNENKMLRVQLAKFIGDLDDDKKKQDQRLNERRIENKIENLRSNNITLLEEINEVSHFFLPPSISYVLKTF